MILIDGSVMEGVRIFILPVFMLSTVCLLLTFHFHLHFKGGQILRMSIALSALLKKPIKIIKIRAGRKNSGLAAQHMNGIQQYFATKMTKILNHHPIYTLFHSFR